MPRRVTGLRLPVAFCVLAVLTASCGSSDNVAIRVSGTTSPNAPVAGAVPPPPLSPRQAPAVAITGNDIVVYGGIVTQEDGTHITKSDGAMFDSASGKWRAIAAAPFSEGLYQPAAVTTDDGGVVVLGLPCGTLEADLDVATCEETQLAAAEYVPSENKWQTLPSSELLQKPDHIAGGASPLGWTGSEAVFGVAISPAPTMLAYTPKSHEWTKIPAVAGIVEPYCGTAGGLVAIGGQEVASQDPPDGSAAGTNTHLYTEGVWLEPSREPVALDDQLTSRIVCGDNAVVFLPWHKSLEAGPSSWFDSASATWQPAPELAIPAGKHISVSALGDGTRVVAFASDGALQIFTSSPAASDWTKATAAADENVTLRAMGSSLVLQPSDPVSDGFSILSASALK